MQAFLIHDHKKQLDVLAIPETDFLVPVNREVMETFIAVTPDFSAYVGERLNSLPPEAFGQVVATRKTDGDVCIINAPLWQQRMAFHLGFQPKSGV